MKFIDVIVYAIMFWPIFDALAAAIEKPHYDEAYFETTIRNDYRLQLSQVLQLPFSIVKSAALKKYRRQVKTEENKAPATDRKSVKHRRRRRCKNRENCYNRPNNVFKLIETRRTEVSQGSLDRKKNNNLKTMKLSTKSLPKIFVQSESIDYDVPTEFDINPIKDSFESSKAPRGTDFSNTLKAFISSGSIYQSNSYSSEKTKGSWLSGGYDIDGTLDLISSKSTVNHSDEDPFKKSLISIYMDHHNPMHENLIHLMTELFRSLNNNSMDNDNELLPGLSLEEEDVEHNESNIDKDNDFCQRWLDTKDKLDAIFLGPSLHLPACPCFYPSNIFYNDKIWDENQQKYFRWRDVSSKSQRLDVYKPSATYCVRSLLTQGSGSAAAQHCCYDQQRRLITRGSGAGTPNFVSPEASPMLHEKIDILPWQLCKGDFSRFNKMRPPNNENSCKLNPDDEEYQRQKDEKKFFKK